MGLGQTPQDHGGGRVDTSRGAGGDKGLGVCGVSGEECNELEGTKTDL